eukprot:Trichotokara_eunicae@DN7763_c0_g1_i1.p1
MFKKRSKNEQQNIKKKSEVSDSEEEIEDDGQESMTLEEMKEIFKIRKSQKRRGVQNREGTFDTAKGDEEIVEDIIKVTGFKADNETEDPQPEEYKDELLENFVKSRLNEEEEKEKEENLSKKKKKKKKKSTLR